MRGMISAVLLLAGCGVSTSDVHELKGATILVTTKDQIQKQYSRQGKDADGKPLSFPIESSANGFTTLEAVSSHERSGAGVTIADLDVAPLTFTFKNDVLVGIAAFVNTPEQPIVTEGALPSVPPRYEVRDRLVSSFKAKYGEPSEQEGRFGKSYVWKRPKSILEVDDHWIQVYDAVLKSEMDNMEKQEKTRDL